MGQILIIDSWTQGVIDCVAGWTQASLLSLLLLLIWLKLAEFAAKKENLQITSVVHTWRHIPFNCKRNHTRNGSYGGQEGVEKKKRFTKRPPIWSKGWINMSGVTEKRSWDTKKEKNSIYLKENTLPQTITKQTEEWRQRCMSLTQLIINSPKTTINVLFHYGVYVSCCCVSSSLFVHVWSQKTSGLEDENRSPPSSARTRWFLNLGRFLLCLLLLCLLCFNGLPCKVEGDFVGCAIETLLKNQKYISHIQTCARLSCFFQFYSPVNKLHSSMRRRTNNLPTSGLSFMLVVIPPPVRKHREGDALLDLSGSDALGLYPSVSLTGTASTSCSRTQTFMLAWNQQWH